MFRSLKGCNPLSSFAHTPSPRSWCLSGANTNSSWSKQNIVMLECGIDNNAWIHIDAPSFFRQYVTTQIETIDLHNCFLSNVSVISLDLCGIPSWVRHSQETVRSYAPTTHDPSTTIASSQMIYRLDEPRNRVCQRMLVSSKVWLLLSKLTMLLNLQNM